MKSRERELLFIYLAFDLFMLNASLLLAAWINLDISVRDYHFINQYILHGNLSWIITYVAFSKKNLYLRDSFLNRIWRISKRQVMFMLVAGSLSLVFIPESISRNFIFEYCLILYIAKIAVYWIVYRYLRFRRGNRINSTNAALMGCNETGGILQNIIKSNPNLGYVFSGFICSDCTGVSNYLGHPDNLEELIDKHNIHVIFYTISFFNGGNAEKHGKEILQICNRKGIRLYFIPTNQQWFRRRLNMESVGDMLVINPQEIPLDYVAFRFQKRLFDIVFSVLVILFLFSWLFPILAIIIKLDSKGPVFFAQNRTGINNKTFKCLKFRSMKVNGSADAKQATANDDRITKVGRFLRKSNIDELPQFLNVLAGNMSVAGPRPHMLKHTEQYSALINHYLIRHYVKPGITGWAQVKGYRGETRHVRSMEKRVKADMEYIENWTFSWDLKIIWLTVFGEKAWKNAG
ncbi:exopolysaccharide biosynthesis polyprenyl glycosylphosphotransferase [Prolixibacteraceae bacterium Z1-6]|uniref:Exopolysaccharide biosynthesis polyprenyl glycosylphosphotransferase n=1 Tax=Draconibacterium aestuarii TaxID=2998507 RepID=A0A9X3FAT5_9BACT|nr:exopolysaccharide biosynthesis polyprenyl glycosylphosphotransferase [Prolixibacteraceae bacterium Z1-6]